MCHSIGHLSVNTLLTISKRNSWKNRFCKCQIQLNNLLRKPTQVNGQQAQYSSKLDQTENFTHVDISAIHSRQQRETIKSTTENYLQLYMLSICGNNSYEDHHTLSLFTVITET